MTSGQVRERAGAVISDDGRYRYSLWRIWRDDLQPILWVGLNPSTADATTDDATIRRMRNFSANWGFGGILVGNLFALRSTDPGGLHEVEDPFGPENDAYLERMGQKANMIVCCWGAFSLAKGANFYMRALFPDRRLHCLGLTASGQPKHPVRLANSTKPQVYEP